MSERTYYTLEEANARVPWLEQCWSRILQMRAQLRGLYRTLEQLGHPPEPQSLSSREGSAEVLSARARFMGLLEAVQSELSAIHEAGIEVKDIDTGLCDFWSVSVIPGSEVYLCWRYGEKQIDYYHEPHAGFAGRKPIPKLEPKPRVFH